MKDVWKLREHSFVASQLLRCWLVAVFMHECLLLSALGFPFGL